MRAGDITLLLDTRQFFMEDAFFKSVDAHLPYGLGACGIAPTVVYDGVITPHQTPESALARVNDWLPHDH